MFAIISEIILIYILLSDKLGFVKYFGEKFDLSCGINVFDFNCNYIGLAIIAICLILLLDVIINLMKYWCWHE